METLDASRPGRRDGALRCALIAGDVAGRPAAARAPAAATPAPRADASQPAPHTAGCGAGHCAAGRWRRSPRTFTAPAGLLFNTVRADRVDDFEKAMGYLQAALDEIDRRNGAGAGQGLAGVQGRGGRAERNGALCVRASIRPCRAPTTAWAGSSRTRIRTKRSFRRSGSCTRLGDRRRAC